MTVSTIWAPRLILLPAIDTSVYLVRVYLQVTGGIFLRSSVLNYLCPALTPPLLPSLVSFLCFQFRPWFFRWILFILLLFRFQSSLAVLVCIFRMDPVLVRNAPIIILDVLRLFVIFPSHGPLHSLTIFRSHHTMHILRSTSDHLSVLRFLAASTRPLHLTKTPPLFRLSSLTPLLAAWLAPLLYSSFLLYLHRSFKQDVLIASIDAKLPQPIWPHS